MKLYRNVFKDAYIVAILVGLWLSHADPHCSVNHKNVVDVCFNATKGRLISVLRTLNPDDPEAEFCFDSLERNQCVKVRTNCKRGGTTFCSNLCMNVITACTGIFKRIRSPISRILIPTVQVCQSGKEANGCLDFEVKKRKQSVNETFILQHNEEISLNCDDPHEVIKIQVVKHTNSTCCGKRTALILSALCNGRSHCTVRNSIKTFAQYCRRNLGIISINTKCVAKDGNDMC